MSIWSKLQRLTNCLNLTPRCLDGGVANGSAKMPVQPVHDKIVPLCWVYEKCVLYFVQCTLYNVQCTLYIRGDTYLLCTYESQMHKREI